MTEKELFEKICQLQKIIDNLEQENHALRTANTMLQNEIKVLKHKAEVGEVTARFFKEIKQIVME